MSNTNPNQQQQDIDALEAYYDALNNANEANKAFGNLAPQDKVAVYQANNPSPYTCCPSGQYIPNPPEGPIYLAVISGSSLLFWSYVDDGQLGFNLERSLNGILYVPYHTITSSVVRIDIDSNVTESNTYWYRINAYNNDGTSSWSNTASIYFPVTPPPGPISMSVFSSSAMMSWSYTPTNELLGWEMERSTDGLIYANLTTSAVPGRRNYEDTSAQENNTYWYRVRAYNSAGTSPYSNTSSIFFPLPAPYGPISLSLESGSALLSWSYAHTTETGFTFEKSTTGITYSFLASIEGYPDLTRQWEDSGVSYGNTYWYRMYAFNPSGSSAYSNTASIYFPIPAPYGPISLSLSSGSSNLNWTYTDTTQDGFKIYKSTNGLTYTTYSTVANASSRSFIDSAVQTGSTYWYAVAAYNNSGSSNNSNTASIYFDIPAPYGIISASVLSGSSIVSWSYVDHAQDGFNVAISANGSPYSVSVQIPVWHSRSYLDTDVVNGNTYSYQVNAYNMAGTSSWSNTASIVFPLSPPYGPISLSLASGSTIMSWSYTDTNQDGFNFEKSTDGLTYTWFTSISGTGAHLRSWIDNAVSGGSTYWYRMNAFNAGGTSSYSNTASIAFAATTPISLSVASGSAVLTWVSQSNNKDYFAVQRSLDGITYSDFVNVTTESIVTNGGFETSNFNGWTIVDTSNSTTVVSDTNYVHDGVYGAKVGPWGGITGSLTQILSTGNGQAYSLSFWLSGSAGNMFQTWWGGNLVMALYSGDLPLSWSQFSYVVTASGPTTQLQFLVNNEPDYFALDSISVKPVTIPKTYVDTSVTSSVGGSTYWYQVAEVNSIATSSFSNTASITFTAASPPPEAPLFLQVFSGSAILIWTTGSGAPAVDHWAVLRSISGPSGSFTQIGTSSAANLTYRDTTVAQNVTYDYKVAGVNSGGTGSYSNIADISVIACQGIDFDSIVHSGCLGYSSGSTYSNLYGVTIPFTTSVSQSISIWGRSPDFDAYLTLADSNGNVLATNDLDGWSPSGDLNVFGANAALVYNLQSGSYDIEISSRNNAVGRFLVSISPGPRYEYGWSSSIEPGYTDIISSSGWILVGENGVNAIFYDPFNQSGSVYKPNAGVNGTAYSPIQDKCYVWGYVLTSGVYTMSIDVLDHTGSLIKQILFPRSASIASGGSLITLSGSYLFLVNDTGNVTSFLNYQTGSSIFMFSPSTNIILSQIIDAHTASVAVENYNQYIQTRSFQITNYYGPRPDYSGYLCYDGKNDRIFFHAYNYLSPLVASWHVFDCATELVINSGSLRNTEQYQWWECCYSWVNNTYYVATAQNGQGTFNKIDAATFVTTRSVASCTGNVICNYVSASNLIISRTPTAPKQVEFIDPLTDTIVHTCTDLPNNASSTLFEGGGLGDSCTNAYVLGMDPRTGDGGVTNKSCIALIDRNTYLPINYLKINDTVPGGFSPDGYYQYSCNFNPTTSRAYLSQQSYDDNTGRLYSIRCTRTLGQYGPPFTASSADTASCLTFKTDFPISQSMGSRVAGGYVTATRFTSSVNNVVVSDNELNNFFNGQHNFNNCFLSSSGQFLGNYTQSYVHTYSGKNAVFCNGKFYMMSDGLVEQSVLWEPVDATSMLVFDKTGSLLTTIPLTYGGRDWDTDGTNVYVYEYGAGHAYIEVIDPTTDTADGGTELQVGYTFTPSFMFFTASVSATASANYAIGEKNYPYFGRMISIDAAGTTWIYFNNIYAPNAGPDPAPYNVQDTGSGDRIWTGGYTGYALYNYASTRLEMSTGSYKRWYGSAVYCPITDHMYWGAVDINDNDILIETTTNLTVVRSHSMVYNNPQCLVWNKKDRTIEVYQTSGFNGLMSIFDPVANTVVCYLDTLSSGSYGSGGMGWSIDTDIRTGDVYVPQRNDVASLTGSLQIYQM